MVRVGDKAPDAILLDQNEQPVRLSTVAPGKSLVVFFYPKDGSPICTREVCAFRDNTSLFTQYEAQVVGVSSDDVKSHRRVSDEHHLNYPLLWDRDGALRKSWGVPATMGVLPGRVTYVLDESGVVRRIFSAQLAAGEHVRAALEAVRTIHAVKGGD